MTNLTNVIAGNAMFSTLNRSDPSAWCPHCDNQGLVVLTMLDGVLFEDGTTAVPCPMCEKGAVANGSSIACSLDKRLSSGKQWRFWSGHDVAASSWGAGYTSRHRRRCQFHREGRSHSCGQPAEGKWCDYHAVDATRGAPARGKLVIPKLQPLESGQVVWSDEALERRKQRVQDALDLNERLERAGKIEV